MHHGEEYEAGKDILHRKDIHTAPRQSVMGVRAHGASLRAETNRKGTASTAPTQEKVHHRLHEEVLVEFIIAEVDTV